MNVIRTQVELSSIAPRRSLVHVKANSLFLLQGMCYIQCAMNYCLIVVSMMTLGFVSVDRFIHIVYPLHYINIVTATRVRITIIWTWIQGLIIGKCVSRQHFTHAHLILEEDGM